MRLLDAILILLASAASGCQTPALMRGNSSFAVQQPVNFTRGASTHHTTNIPDDLKESATVVPATFLSHSEEPPAELPASPGTEIVELEDVVRSVHRSFPLLMAALLERDAAFGEHLAAHGGFDLKLKGASENDPVGFYETFRQRVGVEQPTYWGGSLFGGYRIGRGEFQPWYLERQTDDGGEFKAGVALPLARDVEIDSRRAQLWRTNVGRQLAEPAILLQRLDFVRMASYSHWDWVAAGRRYQIASALLKLAEGRNDAIRRKVEIGDTEPPVLQDNRRLIVSREAKLIEARRKLQQSAIKLSLYYRDDRGRPLIVGEEQLPDFPSPKTVTPDALMEDIDAALVNRPELREFNLRRQQLEIDLAAARNDLLPDIQAVVSGSQDLGVPASSKDDKSEFELEAGMYVDVPVQRRKARGKMTTIEAKLGQLTAKQHMTVDKIRADVQAVYAALVAAYQQIERARESVDLANQLADVERRKFELGESDLLSLNLREQQAAEAQGAEVDALYEYFTAAADYRAILARE